MERPISKLFKKSSFAVLVISLATAVVSSLTYFYGYLFPKSGLVFLGRSVVNSADTYIYLSNIISAKEGKVILPNLYTTESKVPFLIKPLYYLLGRISFLTNLPPVAIFHFSRFFLTIIFVLVLYKFISLFIKKESGRFVALLVVLYSSGLGFFVRQVLPSSIDLWVPEANSFFTLLESPHFILTQTLILLFVYLLIKFKKNKDKKTFLFSSLLASLVILEHPFMTPFVLLFVLGLISFFFGNFSLLTKLLFLFQFFLMPTFSILTVFIFLLNSEAAYLMQVQNILPSPPLINIVTGYGILLLLALVGFYAASVKRRENALLIWWILLTFILIYMPFSFQRRLLEGVHIPISILSTIGIFYICKMIKTSFLKRSFAVVLVILLPITNIYNSWYMIKSFADDSRTNYVYHLDKAEIEGMQWLAQNTSYGNTILANFFYSNIIPGITGRFVYHGHRIQTWNSKLKQFYFDQFMKENDSKLRKKFLKENQINYIYFGRNDFYNRFLTTFVNQDYVEKIWQKEGVEIFRVLIDAI